MLGVLLDPGVNHDHCDLEDILVSLFVEDLKDIGMRLKQTQDSYDAAHNKLTSGKGNLVSRAEKVRQLGAKASKRLPLNLVGSAREGDEPEAIESNELNELNAAPETMELFEESLFQDLLPAEESETAPLTAKGAAGDQ